LQRAKDLRKVSTVTPKYTRRWLTLSTKVVDDFVYELGREEPNYQARAKIDSLKLTENEWKKVENFIDLLKVIYVSICGNRYWTIDI